MKIYFLMLIRKDSSTDFLPFVVISSSDTEDHIETLVPPTEIEPVVTTETEQIALGTEDLQT